MKKPYWFISILFALAIAVLIPAQTTLATGERLRTLAFNDDVWATSQSDGWAIVDRPIAPQVTQVRTPSGDRFRVWHVGVTGPPPSAPNWHARATQAQVNVLPSGTKVYLESQEGVENPTQGQWTYRHIYKEAMPDVPVGAELLRSGMTWVHPLAKHPFVDVFADEQANAVTNQAGLWGETQSSSVYLPKGAVHGGFPINPKVVPVMELLDSTEIGQEIIRAVNVFPVEIGVSQTQRGVMGMFITPDYSVQISQSVMEAPVESVATVLLHELVHTRQRIDMGVLDLDPGCYEMEIEAFEMTAKLWASIHGSNGKRRPEHWLDNQLNETLRDFNNDRTARNVRQLYGHQCGSAMVGFAGF